MTKDLLENDLGFVSTYHVWWDIHRSGVSSWHALASEDVERSYVQPSQCETFRNRLLVVIPGSGQLHGVQRQLTSRAGLLTEV